MRLTGCAAVIILAANLAATWRGGLFLVSEPFVASGLERQLLGTQIPMSPGVGASKCTKGAWSGTRLADLPGGPQDTAGLLCGAESAESRDQEGAERLPRMPSTLRLVISGSEPTLLNKSADVT